MNMQNRLGQAVGQAAQPGGEQRHRRHRGQRIGGQIQHHTGQVADGQRRQQHPEVRAPRRAVQQADAQRGMRMTVIRKAKVGMDVRVTDPGVGVFVRMKFAAQAGMQAKRTNRDQQHADQTLRPGGKALDHGGVFK